MDLKQYTRPLQAVAALGLCLSLAWMTFLVAGFNPSPPTVLDIQARSTQDQSFSSMNSTAAALAANFIGEMMPSPIVMPVTGNEVFTPTPVAAVTLRIVSTFQTTATPFSLFSFLIEPTSTREPRPNDPISTSTPVPSPTSTKLPSATPTRPVPTATRTTSPSPVPPATTAVTPSATPRNEPTATHTPPEESTPTDLPTDVPTNGPTEGPNPTSEPVVDTPEATP